MQPEPECNKPQKTCQPLLERTWEIFGKVENRKDYLYLNASRPNTGQREKKERKRRVKDKKFLRKSEIKVIEAKEYHHCKGSAARIICHSLKGIHYGLSEKVI